MLDYLKTLNPQKSNQILEEILSEAKELKTPIVTDEAINFIIQIITVSKIKKVMEIGSAIGYSAIMMATFTNAEITTIEKDLDSYNRAIANIKKANLENRINVIHADAVEYNLEEDSYFDMIFIDAAKSAYIKYFQKYTKYLNEGGIVIADNLLFHGLVSDPELIKTKNQKQIAKKIDAFNNFLIQNKDFDSYIYSIGDGLSVSIKK